MACTGSQSSAPKRNNDRQSGDCQSLSVPGPGIEPGWVAPTVFETVASTDSAIRAYVSAKLALFLLLRKKFFVRNENAPKISHRRGRDDDDRDAFCGAFWASCGVFYVYVAYNIPDRRSRMSIRARCRHRFG